MKDEALRLALKFIEQVDYPPYDDRPVIAAIKQALEQPEPEPVACIGTNGELMWLDKPKVIYSKPQPLYTSPPKREWQGLTDEEINMLEELYAPPIHPDFVNDADHCFSLIKRVEAKLKEKNGL